MTIFGREPAAIAAAIQAVIALLISFGWLQWVGLSTQTDVAVVMAVVSAGFAVYLAAATNETLLAPVNELFKTTLALAAIYGLHLSTEQTGMAVAVIATVLGLWQRGKVSPLSRLTFGYIAPDDTVTPPTAG